MKFNKLTINYNKTKYMIVLNKRNQSKDNFKISMGQHDLEQVKANKISWSHV